MAPSLLKRVPLWGRMLPLLAAMAGIAVIGAGITGDNPVKVQYPITINSVFTSTAAYAAVYNDSTSFVLSSIARPGDEYEISLDVTNESAVDQNVRFTIDAPEGFPLSISTQEVAIIQEDKTHFVATIEGSVSQTVTFDVQLLRGCYRDTTR